MNSATDNTSHQLQGREGDPADDAQVERSVVPYDESLLERARTQWQFGDWQSLAQLDRDTLQHHPDRAKLALLAAAGRLQIGQIAEVRQYIRLARDWGVSNKLVSQVLIAGVHNSIGRAATIGNQQLRAKQHFENAITIGTPGGDVKLLTRARCGEQLRQLGLNTPDGYLKESAGEVAVTDVRWEKCQSTPFVGQSRSQRELRELVAQHDEQLGPDKRTLRVNHIDSRIQYLDSQLAAIEAEKTFLRKQQQSKYYTDYGYDAKRYWNDRHTKYKFNMQGVGNKELSDEENQKMYQQAKEVLLALCKDQHIVFSDSSILDIGCGTGFYAGVFQSNGVVKYLGIDISGVLLDELRNKHPSFEFKEVDVTEELLSGTYDLVIMIDVTQHIVSADKFSFAMQNIKKCLRNNGVFIVTSWLNKELKNSFYEISRGIEDYRNEFLGWRFSEPIHFRDKFVFSITRSV